MLWPTVVFMLLMVAQVRDLGMFLVAHFSFLSSIIIFLYVFPSPDQFFFSPKDMGTFV